MSDFDRCHISLGPPRAVDRIGEQPPAKKPKLIDDFDSDDSLEAEFNESFPNSKSESPTFEEKPEETMETLKAEIKKLNNTVGRLKHQISQKDNQIKNQSKRIAGHEELLRSERKKWNEERKSLTKETADFIAKYRAEIDKVKSRADACDQQKENHKKTTLKRQVANSDLQNLNQADQQFQTESYRKATPGFRSKHMPKQTMQFKRQECRDKMKYVLDNFEKFEKDFENFDDLKSSLFFEMLSDKAVERVTSIFNRGYFDCYNGTNNINSTVLSRHVKICYEFVSIKIRYVKLRVRYFDPDTEIKKDGNGNWVHFRGPNKEE